MAKQNQIGKKFKNENEREWNERYEEVGTMNNILRMNLVLLSDKLKAFMNEGFNYKDRKITRAGKIWVKDGKEPKAINYEFEEQKLKIKSQIRNAILCKDLTLLKDAIESAYKNPKLLD